MKKKIETVIEGFFVSLIVSIAVCLMGFLLAYPIKWCWNMTMPYIFGLPTIGYWQAFFFYYLCGILIRSKEASNSKPEK